MKKKEMIVSLFVFLFFFVTISVIPIDHSQAEDQKTLSIIRAPVVHTFTGSVSQGSDSIKHTFSVPSDTILVEVELSFSSSYDFDLSLWDNYNRRTGGWTASDRAIRYNIPNSAYSGYYANPEWIEVDPPATSGIWTTGCYSYRGSGSYTITVTVTGTDPDITPPTVDITSPANGATVSGTITISATASDNVGVDYVSFQVDGGTIATDSSSPYSTTLDTTTLSDGSHTITAIAYDAVGNYDDDVITVNVDNSEPDNELTSGVPVTGVLSSVGETEMWYIEVGANAESMHSVLTCGSSDFDLYGRLDAEPTTSTYDWRGYTYGGEDVTYNDPGEGTWYIMVRDYSGSGAYELTVTITYAGPDITPPTININSPSQGSTVTTTDVTVIWTGSDDDSGIDYYEIRLDGGSWTNKGTSTTHTYTGLSETTHTVEVRAWDVAGNDATDSVSFTVDTSASQVTKYAVIVGISDYKAINDLNYCDEDATDWYYHLTGSQMDYDYIWVYGDNHPSNYPQYDGIATEYNVKQALTNMVNLADSDDIIAFITSGHGSGNGYGSSYLCQWDCYAGENGEDGDFYDTELKAILEDAVADQIFVFIDHCYSGGFGPDLMSMSNSDNVYLTTTCTDDGYGYDSPSNNNGLWTYYFLDYSWQSYFGGQASVSMEDVFNYAHAAYPYGGGDEPEEYDGNTSEAFYLA